MHNIYEIHEASFNISVRIMTCLYTHSISRCIYTSRNGILILYLIISPPAGSGDEDMDVISATLLEKVGCGVPWQCWI